MREVGVLEAKTNLSSLLDSVEAGGEEILITRHGRPVAKLSAASGKARPPHDLADQVRKLRADIERRYGVDPDFDWKEAVEDGRE